MRLLVIAGLMLGLLQAAFVPPADGPVPFRRDKVPLPVGTMTTLSRDLVVLAGEADPGSAGGRRTVAQLLALALALDPANRQARVGIERAKQGAALPREEVLLARDAKRRGWEALAWLEQPEAGADGQALAACFGDLLARSDASHPGAAERVAAGEQGNWQGWVAAVEDFEDRPEVVKEPEPARQEPKKAALALDSASVRMPMWSLNAESREASFSLAEVRLHAVLESRGRGLNVVLPRTMANAFPASRWPALQRFLESRHGPLPGSLQLRLEFPERSYDVGENGTALAGAVVVLADAVFSGKEPRAAVLASFEESGELVMPGRIWNTLRAAESLPAGGTIVIPAAASKLLPAFLALNSEEFFINQEFLLAKDPAALCELASSQPPERVLSAARNLAEIRRARGTRSLGNFLVNTSVRQRVLHIVSECPEHASARMLALRGTPDWPKRLDQADYAREIRAALEPMRRALAVMDPDELQPLRLKEAEDACRERLEKLQRRNLKAADRTEFFDPAIDAVRMLRELEDLGQSRTYQDTVRRRQQWFATRRAYADLVAKLTRAVGDPDTYPLPKAR